MTQIKFLFALVLTVAFAQAHAIGMMTYTANTQTVTFPSTAFGGISAQLIPDGATAKVGANTYQLTTVGSALRDVQSFIVVHGYVAYVMVSDPSQYEKMSAAAALASLAKQKTISITLNWMNFAQLNIVDADFQNSFGKNNIPYTSGTAMGTFIADVNLNGPGLSGGAMTILINRNDDGTQTLVVENVAGGAIKTQTIANSKEDLMHEIFSIWLGVTTDSLLAAAQTELLK